MNQWRYYNHAAIPTTAPHEVPDLTPINNGTIWNIQGGTPLLARWTTDWDCGYDTGWWYVIKDVPFDITKLKSKRRYVINKGINNFCVKRIIPADYAEAIYEIRIAAYSMYPPKYRPSFDKDSFIISIRECTEEVYGAFYRETNELCGYAILIRQQNRIDFSVLKVKPEFEKLEVNAALVYGLLEDQKDAIIEGKYICDGERPISHETHFQDYLEKYFGFRKVYCKLNIVYRPKIRWFIKCLYPFRRILYRFDETSIFHNINSVLKMEEIVRKQNNI